MYPMIGLPLFGDAKTVSGGNDGLTAVYMGPGAACGRLGTLGYMLQAATARSPAS